MERIPLATDKAAAQAMLGELVKKVERGEANITTKFDEHVKRPLLQHLEDFRRYLAAKGNTERYVELTYVRAKAVLDACKFIRWSDISPSAVVEYLGELRKTGLGVATCNYYLGAIGGFTRWLLRDRRVPENPLAHLSRQNAKIDCPPGAPVPAPG